MKLRSFILTCTLVLYWGAGAKACDSSNLAMAFLFGYNGWNNRPMVMNNFTPPYFALHPPVYYGERYYRPYGASPFAAWPQLQANPAYQPRLGANSAAVMMDNPYCEPSPSDGLEQVPTRAPEVVRREAGPLIIDNPYFEEAQARLTSTGVH